MEGVPIGPGSRGGRLCRSASADRCPRDTDVAGGVTTKTAQLTSLEPLVARLRADGYRVIGPTVRDGAIMLAELESAAQLPYGWGAVLEPGGYRLRRRDDQSPFGHAAGPQSWKTYLHPPRAPLWTARRDPEGGLTVTEHQGETPRYAFLDVRACDLRAIGIQDRVLGGGAHREGGYAARRAAAFIIAVNCTQPGRPASAPRPAAARVSSPASTLP